MRGTYQFRPTGICLDVPPEQAPPDCWTFANNVTFESGITTRVTGEIREGTSAAGLIAVPRYVAYAGDSTASGAGVTFGAQAWLYAGNTAALSPRVVAFGDIATLNRTPAGWGTAFGQNSKITGGVLNGACFINHSEQDNSLAWGQPGAAGLLATFVPAADDRFRSVRPYKYQLVGLGLNNIAPYDYPQRVNWTVSAAPGSFPSTWAPLATNDAGSVEVTDCRGRLIDSGRLGEDQLIYAEGSTHLMTYVGGQEVMAFRGLSTQSGILRPGCWADAGKFHVVLTTSDVVAVDASGVQSIAAGWVRRAIFGPNGVMSLANVGNLSHVVHHRARREIWIVVQDSDSGVAPTLAYVWQQDTGKWGTREVQGQAHAAAGFLRAVSVDSESSAADVVLCCTNPNGTGTPGTGCPILVADEPIPGTPPTYATVVGQVGRHDMDLGEPCRVKLVSAVRPRIQTAAGAGQDWQVRAGGRNSSTEAIAWSPWRPFNPTTDDTVQLFAQGRLIAVELQDGSGSNKPPWRLSGLDIDYQLRGKW